MPIQKPTLQTLPVKHMAALQRMDYTFIENRIEADSTDAFYN